MPIYEYGCAKCGKRSSALLASWAASDPPCPHCGSPRVRRLVSTFAAPRSASEPEHEHDHADFGEDAYDGGDGGFGDEGGDFDDF